MKRNFLYISETYDAHANMARDEWFLKFVKDGDLILNFYQNENAVIIGKNQNPWLECDLDAMARDCDDIHRYLNLFGYNPKYGVSGPRISSVRYVPQGYRETCKLYEKEPHLTSARM